MIAQITKITQETGSRNGGTFFFFFFRDQEGRSYRSHIVPGYRNFSRWREIMKRPDHKEIWLDGLALKLNGMIDADSIRSARIIEPAHEPKQEAFQWTGSR